MENLQYYLIVRYYQSIFDIHQGLSIHEMCLLVNTQGHAFELSNNYSAGVDTR